MVSIEQLDAMFPQSHDQVQEELRVSLARTLLDRPSRTFELLDWNGENRTLLDLLKVLESPLDHILNDHLKGHVRENVDRINKKFPGGIFLGPNANYNIARLVPSQFPKIGKRFIRRIAVGKPWLVESDAPEKNPLFDEKDDQYALSLHPGIIYTIPFAILKLGNDELADPVRASILYARHYSIRSEHKQPYLTPLPRGKTHVVYEDDRVIGDIEAKDEKKRLQAHLRQAWAMNNPLDGGIPGSRS